MRRPRRTSRHARAKSVTRTILAATGMAVFLLCLPIMAIFFSIALLTGLWWPLPWIALAIVAISLVTAAGLASGEMEEADQSTGYSLAPSRAPGDTLDPARIQPEDILRACTVTHDRTQRVIVERAELASSYWSRFWGLMGRRALAENEGLLIEPCSSIHTMFMRFAIDAIFLDEDRRIVKIASVRPYRAALGGGSRSVLEVPAGTAERNGLKAGDALTLTALSEA